ncbi:MAG: DUF4245 domain-containing protein [Nocardioides sp.]
MSGQAGRYQRSAAGMIGAMAVLLVVVVGYVALQNLNNPAAPNPVKTVDYSATEHYARQQAPFALVAPKTLPAGWRATTVSFIPGVKAHWHLGLLTDQGRYVGLEQSRLTEPDMVHAYVDKAATRGGRVDVAGTPWTSWTDSGGDLALVRTRGRTTTLVVGHVVPRAALVSFAASLR